MRTNIVIDDEIMSKALKISGLRTKKDAVEKALKLFIQVMGQRKLKSLKGTIAWEGDLEKMRID